MKKKERETQMDKKRQIERCDQREKVKKGREENTREERKQRKQVRNLDDKQLKFDREDVKRKNLTNVRGIILMTYKF